MNILLTATLAASGLLIAITSLAAILQFAALDRSFRLLVIAETLDMAPAILLARTVLRLRFTLLGFHASSIIVGAGILAGVQYIGIIGLLLYATVAAETARSAIKSIRERSAENAAAVGHSGTSGT